MAINNFTRENILATAKAREEELRAEAVQKMREELLHFLAECMTEAKNKGSASNLAKGCELTIYDPILFVEENGFPQDFKKEIEDAGYHISFEDCGLFQYRFHGEPKKVPELK